MALAPVDAVPADLNCCNSAGSFLQSAFWGSFKARFGWNARAFRVSSAYFENLPLLLIRRKLCPGLSFAYSPWGPEFPDSIPPAEKHGLLAELAAALRPLLPQDTAFIRFDIPWYAADSGFPLPLASPFIRAGADVQPPDSVLVFLNDEEHIILKNMKPKWRYNIKLAYKSGVEIRRLDEKGLDAFYALYLETAERDGLAIHSSDYYKTLFDHCRDYPGGGQELRLYMAQHEGEAIAGAIALFRGETATYLYGASANHKRNLMATYALQWQAMKDAKAFGCLQYDLFGIPPNQAPGHPMAGLYRFKTGFGGLVIHRGGSWDYPCRPVIYRLFNRAEYFRRLLRGLKKTSRRTRGH